MKPELDVICGERAPRRRLATTASFLVLAMLAGCGSLTRVDKETHFRQVESFGLVGLHHDEAVRRVEAAGFTCTAYRDSEPFVWPSGAEVPVYRRICSKASFEMFCPQRRYVEFHYTPEQQVVHVKHPPRIEEHSCF